LYLKQQHGSIHPPIHSYRHWWRQGPIHAVINPTVKIRASAEVLIQSTTKVIHTGVCHLLVSQTATTVTPTLLPIATVTGGAEVQIHAINPAAQAHKSRHTVSCTSS